MHNALMDTYKRLPITFVRGEGAWLWDTNNNRYLDALSGIAVCGLGHAHPDITQALCQQASTLIHTSNLYGIPLQEELAALLTKISGMDKVFFANSGAEANEAALKLARLYGRKRGYKIPTVVVMEGSFHGRTLATLTATGNRKVQAGFEPLVQGFIRVPYGDITSLNNLATGNNEIVAVMVEPIQGEGGINIPNNDYLPQIRDLCNRQDWLLITDEIQTGLGRTGRMFAYQHHGIIPDIVTIAKSLGNGVPIGACLATGQAATLFEPGSHGSTFGGNLLACRAALTVLTVLERDNLVERSANSGSSILTELQQRLANQPGVVTIRGRGLMIGIELVKPCAELVTTALDSKLLINVTAERVIRLLPPLIMDATQIQFLVATLSGLIERFLSSN
ncbi:acetylornithine aminotransferase [Achromatium sp. WMS2]|nr:acetylornithine aminotransferase [Achromatium sp. WMS2]